MNELLTGLQLEISLYPLLGYLLGAAAILLITAVAEKICTFVLRRFIREAENRGIAGLGNFLAAFVKPLRYLVYLLGIYLAIRYLPLTQSADIMTGQICRSLLIIILGMGFYDLCAIDSLFSEEIRNNLHLDIILLPFFSKLLRFIIIALVIVLVANEWGYEVNGFIAGLGLGGSRWPWRPGKCWLTFLPA
ncbi:mechanosensitive ion channel family protein [Syntrophomonas palmitatica]|uniref:mechanosensitive ion channel family protein n=1 Tax=Syntrophomonas palmitatica TaxID=402877 RepID=UPI0006CFDA01|nr:mechanosensitive ion channel family protein [Syntrophomonas palmitatica]